MSFIPFPFVILSEAKNLRDCHVPIKRDFLYERGCGSEDPQLHFVIWQRLLLLVYLPRIDADEPTNFKKIREVETHTG